MVDTGPPYPPMPAAGSNAIGKIHIGVAQVGEIPEFEWLDTFASQYANSPIIMGLVERFFGAADQTENLELFYDDIWNIATAQGYGLDVWGRIVGINRILEVVDTAWFGFAESEPGTLSWNTGVTANLSPAIGFGEAMPGWEALGWGTFGLNYSWSVSNVNQGGGAYYSGTGLTSSYRMADETYRTLILAKARQNISDCSIPSINQTLLSIFPNRGNAYVTDGYQGVDFFGFSESKTAQPFGQQAFYDGQALNNLMVMTYTFNFALSPVDMAIVLNSGVLPKPTGVAASVVINV
jgi:hypothetical protein